MSIDSAIIMAAGLGQRIPSYSRYCPKGFIEVGGVSLIERSLSLLREQGIEKVIIGTGHLSHFYEKLALKFKGLDITLVYNEVYAKTGSLETFLRCCELVDGSFLSLESDLIYHTNILQHLLEMNKDNILIGSGRTYSGDEVYIGVDEYGYLNNLSKNLDDIDAIYAELVGICRFDKHIAGNIQKVLKQRGVSRPCSWHYEEGLVAVSSNTNIKIEKVNFPWAEIDMLEHLQRVEKTVWPAICELDVFENQSTR
ncbi:phosphocholine cytidylyltransferase family protein [Shewanella surugensis]|uniref:Phosphocholine cytidylyltransferase family protein n=1 Tax=Shewanella surugensis TaxID=212020 RepID=A0ABT0LHP2_9GAMM|nr:phosphocholine cytidylyltransferase family protein [Shewanella surugensis]MCL1127222.1 phosphocholine cytidylyltransferase family protein [Shewanella surugensis]